MFGPNLFFLEPYDAPIFGFGRGVITGSLQGRSESHPVVQSSRVLRSEYFFVELDYFAVERLRLRILSLLVQDAGQAYWAEIVRGCSGPVTFSCLMTSR